MNSVQIAQNSLGCIHCFGSNNDDHRPELEPDADNDENITTTTDTFPTRSQIQHFFKAILKIH